MDAARKARLRRSQKASALALLRNNRVTLQAVLLKPPDALATCDLWDVLLACPKLGRQGARTVCERAGAWPHTHLGQLTRRERYDIVRSLPARVTRRPMA